MLRQATKKLSAGLPLRAAANWGSLQTFNRSQSGMTPESNHGSNLPRKLGTLSPAARPRVVDHPRSTLLTFRSPHLPGTTQVGDNVKAGSSTPMPADLNGGKQIFRPNHLFPRETSFSPPALSTSILTSDIPLPSIAVLDASAQTLFLTEMFRGMSLAMKYFWEPKVTVSAPQIPADEPCLGPLPGSRITKIRPTLSDP
jgi:NADH dehydrogenase (ubiquinone) Fe-S protein 8